MTTPSALDTFVHAALARGASRDETARALADAGWPAARITGALNAWSEVPFRVPVPRPQPSLSARDAFWYLLLFATLYVWVWQLGSLLFDLINHLLPDPADPAARGMTLGASMRWSVASLLVAFPVFAFVAHVLARALARDPLKRLSPVRRWLTYLTLFLAAGVLIGDTIALVYNALGGELTLRFVLKVGVVGVIAGAVFAFYLLDLRRDEVEA